MRDPAISRRGFVGAAAPAIGAFFAPGPAAGAVAAAPFNVRQLGAAGDGRAKDTRAIQETIDKCHGAGGGTVYFPPGIYLSGSVRLKSGIAMHLDHGATLRASEDIADFDKYETLGFKNAADRETSFFHQSLIWAEDAENIAITGTGLIDGNRKRRGGPKAIALKRCKFVTVSGLTIRDVPNYCISLLGTDYVNVDGVTIFNGYADGIDPDCCRHVRIANCHIESWDDAIVPKTSFSLGERRSTENVAVTNCVLATNCNAFKLGTESGGDFRNITVSNCTMFSRSPMRPPISGVSLLTVDGATIDGVTVSNIAMTDVRCPVFLRLGNRGRDLETPRAGTLKNVVIDNIVATGAIWPSAVVGIPGHQIEGATFANLRITCKGGGTSEQGRAVVAEHVAKYPTADMFESYPSFGLYCRHARDVRVSGLDLRCEQPDARPAVLCDDVKRLSIDSLDAPHDSEAAVLLRDVNGALVRGCVPRQGTKAFVRVEGQASRRVSLVANDLRGVTKVADLGDGVRPDCVVGAGNVQ